MTSIGGMAIDEPRSLSRDLRSEALIFFRGILFVCEWALLEPGRLKSTVGEALCVSDLMFSN